MKRAQLSFVLVTYVTVALASHAGAINLLYNFEGDAGTTITDKLTSDGTQNGVSYNNVSLFANSEISPGFGSQVGFFDNPPPLVTAPYSTLEIPGTTFNANYSVTLAGWVNQDQLDTGLRRFRVFSSFSGTGGTNNILMLDAGNGTGQSMIRGIVGNTQVGGPNNSGTLSPGYHHYAMTVNGSNGAVELYFDGVNVKSGTAPAGYVNNANLRIGEDVANFPVSNSAPEQIVGNVDDVLVLNRVLSPTDISALYAGGSGATVSSVVTPSASEFAVYYDFEGDTGGTATDKFTLDGSQNTIGTQTAMADLDSANAKVGSGSFSFSDPRTVAEGDDIFTQINAGPVGDLGSNFTLSAVVNPYSTGQFSNGVSRILSTYAGTGATAGQLILDFNPSTATGIRLYLPSNTGAVTLQKGQAGLIDLDPTTKQTLTIVYETGTVNDSVRMYLDGVEIASNLTLPAGTVQTLGSNDLRIGEDRGGYLGAFANENYTGSIDDVMLLSRSLTADQVAFLHANGADMLIDSLPDSDPGDFDGDGDVDGRDFLAWQRGVSPSPLSASDLADWQMNYGGGAIVAAATVPEPSTLLLASGGLLMIFRGRTILGRNHEDSQRVSV